MGVIKDLGKPPSSICITTPWNTNENGEFLKSTQASLSHGLWNWAAGNLFPKHLDYYLHSQILKHCIFFQEIIHINIEDKEIIFIDWNGLKPWSKKSLNLLRIKVKWEIGCLDFKSLFFRYTSLTLCSISTAFLQI